MAVSLWGLGAAEIIEIGNQLCVLSVIADVTDRKQAQEAAARFGRRLLHAQEEERARIARELHDDVNQEIALIAFKLQFWETTVGGLAPDSCDGLHEIRERLLQVGKDVQALSHRLHSSKIEYLGFLRAARRLCDEVTKLHQVQIDFTHSNFPDRLPEEVSRCLYRVLQEALQNAVKHSGARRFAVQLCSSSDGLEMSVGDTGVGFEIEQALLSHGLGLTSMQERMHLVGGQLSLQSQPGYGTNSGQDSFPEKGISGASSRRGRKLLILDKSPPT